jgi:hypothetical protein
MTNIDVINARYTKTYGVKKSKIVMRNAMSSSHGKLNYY